MRTVFLDFQFIRTVFLVIVSATSSILLFVVPRLVADVSAGMHREGVAGKMLVVDSVTYI